MTSYSIDHPGPQLDLLTPPRLIPSSLILSFHQSAANPHSCLYLPEQVLREVSSGNLMKLMGPGSLLGEGGLGAARGGRGGQCEQRGY